MNKPACLTTALAALTLAGPAGALAAKALHGQDTANKVAFTVSGRSVTVTLQQGSRVKVAGQRLLVGCQDVRHWDRPNETTVTWPKGKRSMRVTLPKAVTA